MGWLDVLLLTASVVAFLSLARELFCLARLGRVSRDREATERVWQAQERRLQPLRDRIINAGTHDEHDDACEALLAALKAEGVV